MIQSRSSFGFPHKAFEISFVRGKFLIENFNGDLAVEFFIFGKINLAHSARANLFDDFIMPETFADF